MDMLQIYLLELGDYYYVGLSPDILGSKRDILEYFGQISPLVRECAAPRIMKIILDQRQILAYNTLFSYMYLYGFDKVRGTGFETAEISEEIIKDIRQKIFRNKKLVCIYCGSPDHIIENCGRAKQKRCIKCGSADHISADCRAAWRCINCKKIFRYEAECELHSAAEFWERLNYE